MSFKILKFSSLIIILAIGALAAALFINFSYTKAQTANFELGGWIWTDGYGWISLNSKDCDLLNQQTPGTCTTFSIAYAVSTTGSNVSGYGWSENVGWICFGGTCAGHGTVPGGGSPSAGISVGKMTGWAQVYSLGDDGWINLAAGADISTPLGQVFPACYDCEQHCDEYQVHGSPTTPCIQRSTTTFDICHACFSQTKFDGDNIPNPIIDSVPGGSGSISYNCGTSLTPCNLVTGLIGSRIQCPANKCSNSGTKNYQVYRGADGTIVGWGWNGNSAPSSTIGAGWIEFNPAYGGGYIVLPWLQTLQGSIYTSGGVYLEAIPRTGAANATFCIYTRDISRTVSSANCSQTVTGVSIAFPTSTQQVYRNALGKIDVKGLITTTTGSYDKYGYLVSSIAPWSAIQLNNRVFYINGDLSISSTPITFNNGTVSNKGNGIIIVKGNLYINKNLYYQDATGVTDLSKLASVAWVVLGDVIIDPSVTSTVGAFIVLGNATSNCATSTGGTAMYPQYQQNGCGVFFSGASSNPLTVYGLIMAKAFDFRRTYANLSQGAERIIYDGRLSVNPPPGLQSFSEGLPVIRDTGL